jgi:protein-S-isoprenylcysteine O-methyltransferase Ste14
MSNAVAIGALLFSVWARLSLRRNRGFVPAQREIVTAGAYRFVRHPIYTGLILSYLAVALRIYSPRNITLLAIAVFWMLVKSFVEESFLRADSQYAAYMTKVRARWIPFVI